MRRIVIFILLLASPSLAASLFPRFTFTPVAPMPGAAVAFNASSSICTASPCTYRWTDDADGSSLGVGRMMSFTFKQAGTKYVRLTITDARGKTASGEADVVVMTDVPPPPPPPPPPSGVGLTYYVSPVGNDSAAGASPTTAWKTMAKVQSALVNLHPGDSVLFERGGIWYEQLNLSNVNGTASARITFGNYGTGNLPIIDGGGSMSSQSVNGGRQWCIGGNNSKMSYITIDGFECRNASNYGIAFYDVYNGSAGIIVQNSYIHDTGDGDYGYHNQLMYADYGWNADGTKFLNNKVGSCYGHNCIQIHGDMGNPLIEGNECYGWSHNCIDVKNVKGAVIDSNVVHDGLGNQTYQEAYYIENDGNPSGGWSSRMADVTWTRNVAYGGGFTTAFQCQNAGGPVTCRMYNNTVVSNTLQQGTYGGGSPSFEVKNNIFDTPTPRSGNGYTGWDYNATVQSSPIGPHDLRVNPMFVNAGAHDFHLQAGSPMIGKGTDVGLGGALDLGAFPH